MRTLGLPIAITGFMLSGVLALATERGTAPPMPLPDRVLTDAGSTTSPAMASIDGSDEKGRTTGTLSFPRGTGEMVLHVEFTPDQRWLLAGRFRGQLDFWDTQTWTKVRSIETGHDRVTALAASSDGRYVATGGDDLRIRVWEISSGKLVTEFGGCEDYPTDIEFSPDGHLIMVLVNGGPDFVYDRSQRARIRKVSGNDAAFLGSGETAVTVLSEELSLWDVERWVAKSRLRDPGGSMHTLAVDEKRNRVAVGSFEDGTKIWDLTSQKVLIHMPSGYTGSLALSPDGQLLLTAGDGFIRLWSIESGRQMCASDDIGLWEIALSSGARWLAAGVDDTVQIWEFSQLLQSCPGQVGQTQAP